MGVDLAAGALMIQAMGIDADGWAANRATSSFEEKAVAIAARLRTEMAALIAALPERVEGGTDLNRQLGLGSTLCWLLHSFANSTNPIAVLSQVPGKASMDRLLKSARRKGVPEDLLARLLQAYDQFETFAHDEAGSRRSFDAMLASLNPLEREKSDLKERRSTFRSNSHLWGIQSRVSIGCIVLYPGNKPGTIDSAQIAGAADLRLLRPDVPVVIGAQHSVFTEPGAALRPNTSVPGVYEGQLPVLIEEFCSKPVPKLTYRRSADGRVDVVIHPNGWGKTGALTHFRQVIARDITAGQPETTFTLRGFVNVPTEVQYVDMLIPRGWVDLTTVRSASHGCRHDPAGGSEHHPEDVLPAPASAAYLGRGVDMLQTPELDRYPDLVKSVLGGLGWSGEQLDVFRLRVPYPVLHTRSVLAVGTPQPSPARR